ncbi:MAG: serine/threonine-protein phosphatase, partial [Rickettsiales bacterium]|nr:serine/threonine-protein phosphatase [Rickettsiales bacterium]
NNRMNQEIREAGRMQRILLPSDRELNQIRDEQKLDISYLYHPCTDLAGDYLAIQKLSDDETMLISVDVTGHGVSASLYTFAIHTLLKELSKPDADPAELLRIANHRLYSVMDVDKFATIFLGIISRSKKSLRYSAAACPQPILLRKGSAELLKTDGLMLGIEEEQSYQTSTIPFEEGDRLVVYSDALLETSMLDEAFLTEQQIMDFLTSHNVPNSNDMLQQLSLKLFAERLYYLRDDLTMIACTHQ